MNNFISIFVLAIHLLLIQSCANLPLTNFIRIEPVRYVSPPQQPIPNFQFGWVTAEKGKETAFSIHLGKVQADKLWQQTNYVNQYQAATALAERELLKIGVCNLGVVRLIGPIVGEQKTMNISFLVECVKQ